MDHAQWIISEKSVKAIISFLLLLLASSCILSLNMDLRAALPQFFKIAANEGLTNNINTLSKDWRLNHGARDVLLTDVFLSTKIIKNKSPAGLRTKTSNCGLWHPSIVEPKTWYESCVHAFSSLYFC